MLRPSRLIPLYTQDKPSGDAYTAPFNNANVDANWRGKKFKSRIMISI